MHFKQFCRRGKMKYTVIVLVFGIMNFWTVCMSSEQHQIDVVSDLFDSAINYEDNGIDSESFQVANEKNKENFIIPDFMDSPVKGVSFFYLDGRRDENQIILIQELPAGDEAISVRLAKTIAEIKISGFNWVRIIISKNHYKMYDEKYPEYDYSQDIYPLMSSDEAIKINSFIDNFRKGTDGLKIELLLTAGFIDNTTMRDKQNDALFFESILKQIDTTGIELVMLGGDMMPCNIISLVAVDDTICDEDGPKGDWNDAEWIRFQLDYFSNNPIDRLRNLNYSFDTITYPTVNAFKTYLEWVKNNVISYIPIVSVSAYYARPGATEKDYLSHFNDLVNAYAESGLNKPFWFDEYGFGLHDFYSEKDTFLYFKGFLQSTRCKNGVDSSLFYPSVAWVVGSDRDTNIVWPINLKSYGLFQGYNLKNSPIVGQTWELIKWFNNTEGVCSKPIPNYQERKSVPPIGASSLLLDL
ncbi:MAG: hypothetical protein KKI15_05440 [Proteobacteria bacterium]|nr:hypothetical protein [Pseudomonadota bacterium]